MKKTLKRYRLFILMVLIYIGLYIFARDLFFGSTTKAFGSLKEMMLVIPPIFVLLGLLDVWVKKETMVKYMGKDSGIIGVLLGFFLGAAAAGAGRLGAVLRQGGLHHDAGRQADAPDAGRRDHHLG